MNNSRFCLPRQTINFQILIEKQKKVNFPQEKQKGELSSSQENSIQ
ncbi:hypothetical protein CWATWH8502_3224 [Crocosphaera watsonii WH 8502]|uniref:Uncharacterized protein n=3 Tax=Crocosphaera watsonii TaxID=263511 RepID=T2JXQ4_CROWT|nr:hypothetical protein CWATWH8502_3224 [Crocosphaera watsonii WH 8502]CCQ60437.1 hypothetical protein CWATWH0401_724 [Crocosphaera watsonii WH 0401]CCQ69422.1 hypothetical protein CWATWH0402_4229 [Crocosphaera watsonii WH 0402]